MYWLNNFYVLSQSWDLNKEMHCSDVKLWNLPSRPGGKSWGSLSGIGGGGVVVDEHDWLIMILIDQ